MSLPDRVQLNASTGAGAPVEGGLATTAPQWGLRRTAFPEAGALAPPRQVPAEQWRHVQHGWGVVLPMPSGTGWSTQDLAMARDQPPIVQELVASRLRDADGTAVPAPVLRWDPAFWPKALHRHLPDGRSTVVETGVRFGLGSINDVPRYLLILGGPEEVPWSVQYHLQQRHLVGRLALDEEGLGNHLTALLGDFAGGTADHRLSTVWAVDVDEITRDMRATIAHPLAGLLAADVDMAGGHEQLSATSATGAELRRSLDRHPGLVVTTSHGRTGPLGEGQQDAMRAVLGTPVDQHDQLVDLRGWSPEGAIWYAHACCSAGSNHGSTYTDLLEPGTLAHQVVQAVGRLPSTVAPLPTALLGAAHPLRAFIGHVEPTFDWTLRSALTGQPLTEQIVQGLWHRLYQPQPVALAMSGYHTGVGELYRLVDVYRDQFSSGVASARDLRLRARLTAMDCESLVLLGDPTASLPPL